MTKKTKKQKDNYTGFEQGPIRPPSEADSLLLRLTRNCPWNRCTFCPVYKGRKFSIRSVDNIIKDIDLVHLCLVKIMEEIDRKGRIELNMMNEIFNSLDSKDRTAFNAALHWFSTGMKSIFIQDANSLIMKPDDLVYILKHIKKQFPMADRITSYARSRTIALIKEDDLKRIADAGLNRIHIGMESGSDNVLKMIKKGVTKQGHITAGVKIKKAGIELSEYVMPGLGGVEFSEEHAIESADALNRINPDFIRLRSLALPERAPIAEDYRAGKFKKCNDIMMAEEIKLFLENLDGIDSYVKSDHILNLLEEVEGRMPHDKEKMINVVDQFLGLSPERKILYRMGRRMGLFRKLDDLNNSLELDRVKEACRLYNVTDDTIDSVIDQVMKRFV